MPLAGPVPDWLFSITATMFAHLVFAALTLIPYIAWRRRAEDATGVIPAAPNE